jgi:hypothetical protein
MLKVEIAPTLIALLLIATHTVADVTSELASCQLVRPILGALVGRVRRTRQPTYRNGPSLYQGADWNKICLENEWDVRTQEPLSASCYQSGKRISKRACGRLVILSRHNATTWTAHNLVGDPHTAFIRLERSRSRWRWLGR